MGLRVPNLFAVGQEFPELGMYLVILLLQSVQHTVQLVQLTVQCLQQYSFIS